MSDTELHE